MENQKSMNKKIKKALEELQKNIDIIKEYFDKSEGYSRDDEIDITWAISDIEDNIDCLKNKLK